MGLMIEAAVFFLQHGGYRGGKDAVHPGGKALFDGVKLRRDQDADSAIREQCQVLPLGGDVNHVFPMNGIGQQRLKQLDGFALTFCQPQIVLSAVDFPCAAALRRSAKVVLPVQLSPKIAISMTISSKYRLLF